MKNLTQHLIISVVSLALFTGTGTTVSFAENAPGVDKKVKLEELKKLKQENPEKFRELIKERKGKIKEKLQELKERDPEKYEEVRERAFEKRRAKLEELKRENPEKFRSEEHTSELQSQFHL